MDEKELKETAGNFMKLMLQFYYGFQEYPFGKEKGRIKPNTLSFNILFRLYISPEGTLTIQELTEKMQISKPQLIKLVNNLEDASLLIRERFKENRRVVFLSLTEDGRNYILHILKDMEENFLKKMSLRSEASNASFAEGVRKIKEAMDM